MALQIRRGTDAQRLLYTPAIGELVFVTDYLTAGVDPIYVGDGVTLGGVAVGQNAVLSGNMEGDVILNGNDITGTGNLTFTGNINNVGTTTTKKLTITGDGGIAIVSTGSITNTGNVNVSGNIISSGTIQAVTVESDLVGSVLSSDSTAVLVNATTNNFSGSELTLSTVASSITLSGSGLVHNRADVFENYTLGTEDNPMSITQYTQLPNVQYGRITLDSNGTLTTPGISNYITYRGTLADPETILENDRLGGLFFQSFTPSGPGLAGGVGFIAESQAGSVSGAVRSTFIVATGSPTTTAALIGNTILSDTNDILKYTSRGELKITALNLRSIGNAERTALTPFINDGTIIHNYQATDNLGNPLSNPPGRLQVLIQDNWYNIALSGASNI
jgi:hypothetical protein